jgi:hypothetical protein
VIVSCDCGVAIHCKQFSHHMRFENTQVLVLAEERSVMS